MSDRKIYTVERDKDNPQFKRHHKMYVLNDTGGSGGGGGGPANWGNISGNINNQTDLNNRFVKKTTEIAGYDLYNDITAQQIEDATKDITATLENKTIDADDNTIQDLETDNFKQSALAKSQDNVRNYSNSVDTKVATEKFLQKTLHNIETPEQNQDAVNKKYVDDVVAELSGKVMRFKGFVSEEAPTGKIDNGILWYQSDENPDTFPFDAKQYDSTEEEWSSDTIEYTPEVLDLWLNLNNGNGYYWFGNDWNLIDENVIEDDMTICKNISGQIELKDGDAVNGITFSKLNTNLYNGTVRDNNSEVPLNSAVYNELIDDGASEYEYNDTSETKDLLTLKLKNNNGDTILNKEIDFDDKLVLENKEQTVTEKTISADDNTITDLTGDNVKGGYLINSISTSDIYYGFTLGSNNRFTKSTANGDTIVYSINALTKEITLLGQGTVSDDTLTYNGVNYTRNDTIDDYYVDKSNIKLASADAAIYLKKLIDSGKATFKKVTTFEGEVGDLDTLYYLNVEYDDYVKGFYQYNGTGFYLLDFLNEFQKKRITWQGTDNVLLTTVLQQIFEFAAGKVQIVVANTLPEVTEPNTQYWIKTYDDETIENGRYIILTDAENDATLIGTSSVDLSNLLEKPQENYNYNTGDYVNTQEMQDRIAAKQPILVNSKVSFFSFESVDEYCYSSVYDNSTTGALRLRLMYVDKTTWQIRFKTVDVAGSSLDQLISEDVPYTDSPNDTETLSNLDIETAKSRKITFGNLWLWIKSKINGAISTVLTSNLTANRAVITNNDGKLAVSTGITANTTNGLKTFKVNAQGLITEYTAKTLGRGLGDTNNVIGHSNAEITAALTQAVYPTKIDKYGHVTAYGTGQAVTDQYKTSANNQLLNRVGAHNMWKQTTHLCGIFSRSNQSISQDSWTNISLTGSNDVDSTYCSLNSNGIRILKTGIYKFDIVARLADSISLSTFIEWSLGMTGHDDDSSGGEWAATLHRHKTTTSIYMYVTANSTVYGRIYIASGGARTLNYATIYVSCVKES